MILMLPYKLYIWLYLYCNVSNLLLQAFTNRFGVSPSQFSIYSISDCRCLVKTVICGVKTIIWGIIACKQNDAGLILSFSISVLLMFMLPPDMHINNEWNIIVTVQIENSKCDSDYILCILP